MPRCNYCKKNGHSITTCPTLIKKEENQRLWEQAYTWRMNGKYGPRWHWQVQDTEDDSFCAKEFRDYEEVEEYRQHEADFYNEVAQWARENKELKQTLMERSARHALMTEKELQAEEQKENEEIQAATQLEQIRHEQHHRNFEEKKIRDKTEYERNGWPWPPKR